MWRRRIKEAEKTDDCSCIIRRCNEKFRDFTDRWNSLTIKKEKGLQAAAIIYSDHFREIWMIGDCQAMVDGTEYQQPKKKRCDLKSVSQFDDGIGHRGCRCKIQDRTMDLKGYCFCQ